ncbi:MAG: hypothetical protein E7487_06035 [Ruminococcaceae bacterium]|nr:hypothetical protein [Oscillospiraceae bacterium]
MKQNEHTLSKISGQHFFLGANTSSGFVSKFDQLADPKSGWILFVIKGGPGTGKSSLIRKAAAAVEASGLAVEYIHCSSDADSLDGAIFPQLKCAVADGTPPHVIEPKYPGAYESVIFLNNCWDEKKLIPQLSDIICLSEEISAHHQRCCRYLSIATMLQNEVYQLISPHTLSHKIDRYAKGIAVRLFSKSGRISPGKNTFRFLSAVTNQGRLFFSETINTLCNELYFIDDPWGVSSKLLLTRIRSLALAHGYNTITCSCPLSPYDKPDHLIIPELHLAFLSGTPHHKIKSSSFHTVDKLHIIHAERFTEMEMIRHKRQRISFISKMTERILTDAEEQLAHAKLLHDKLETIYTGAMDFSAVQTKTDLFIEKLLQRAKEMKLI